MRDPRGVKCRHGIGVDIMIWVNDSPTLSTGGTRMSEMSMGGPVLGVLE
jgi:hypothetical protein